VRLAIQTCLSLVMFILSLNETINMKLRSVMPHFNSRLSQQINEKDCSNPISGPLFTVLIISECHLMLLYKCNSKCDLFSQHESQQKCPEWLNDYQDKRTKEMSGRKQDTYEKENYILFLYISFSFCNSFLCLTCGKQDICTCKPLPIKSL